MRGFDRLSLERGKVRGQARRQAGNFAEKLRPREGLLISVFESVPGSHRGAKNPGKVKGTWND